MNIFNFQFNWPWFKTTGKEFNLFLSDGPTKPKPEKYRKNSLKKFFTNFSNLCFLFGMFWLLALEFTWLKFFLSQIFSLPKKGLITEEPLFIRARLVVIVTTLDFAHFQEFCSLYDVHQECRIFWSRNFSLLGYGFLKKLPQEPILINLIFKRWFSFLTLKS